MPENVESPKKPPQVLATTLLLDGSELQLSLNVSILFHYLFFICTCVLCLFFMH